MAAVEERLEADYHGVVSYLGLGAIEWRGGHLLSTGLFTGLKLADTMLVPIHRYDIGNPQS